MTASAAKNVEIKNAAISLFSELAMRLGLERVRETSGFASLSNADRTKLLKAPPAGSALAWDDTVDVLLGRVARDGARYADRHRQAGRRRRTGSPRRDGPTWSSRSTTRCATSPPHRSTHRGPGGIPPSRRRSTAALQAADLERFARVFVGLPQLAVVSFTIAGGSVTVHHELRCLVGKVEPAADRHIVTTAVELT